MSRYLTSLLSRFLYRHVPVCVRERER
jgi:hypothetical protein